MACNIYYNIYVILPKKKNISRKKKNCNLKFGFFRRYMYLHKQGDYNIAKTRHGVGKKGVYTG